MYQLVLCTCPNIEVAENVAQCLVDGKLAACVNIMPEITSVYCWQEQVESSKEIQLFIKTTSKKFDALSEKIKAIHPYDVPEIIALNIQQGDNNYLNWINESLK